ncbi:caspase family protein [bacterium]|nr:caspase family protein [bacterium]
MKKSISILICVFFATSLFAQTLSRGVSAVGKIVSVNKIVDKEMSKLFKKTDQPVLACSISFLEASEDGILNEGETGTVLVNVNNNGKKQLQSKLEIKLKTSWNPMPRTSVKLMDLISPGQSGEYKATIKWDERLPSGTLIYEVVAIDTKTGNKSSPVEVQFSIAGKGSKDIEPVFVDVDLAVPRVYVSNKNGVAVIIGNQEYVHRDIPNVDFAIKDAVSMKTYLINMLGYREENIIYVENAQKTDFESIFGTQAEYQGKLYNYVKSNESEVFIYYSGHGAPDLSNKKAYFIPSNSDPNYVKIYGYALDVFYRNIDKIPAKSVTVVLDACFSGGSQQGMLIKNASPMYIDVDMPVYSNKLNLLTSAAGDQISSWYPKANHSLFTYYLMRAIRGEADSNKDRKITFKEVHMYLKDHVPYMARRMYGREQTPGFKGNAQKVISTY